MRQVWQSSEAALLQMVLVVIIKLAGGHRVAHWHDLGTTVQLILVRGKCNNSFTLILCRDVCVITFFVSIHFSGRSLWLWIVSHSLYVSWVLLLRCWSHPGLRVNSVDSQQELCWHSMLLCAHFYWPSWLSLLFSLPLSFHYSHYRCSWWDFPGRCAHGQALLAQPALAQILCITSSSAKGWHQLLDLHLLMVHLVSETY